MAKDELNTLSNMLEILHQEEAQKWYIARAKNPNPYNLKCEPPRCTVCGDILIPHEMAFNAYTCPNHHIKEENYNEWTGCPVSFVDKAYIEKIKEDWK